MTGKDLKRIIVSNIPFEYGLTEQDIHDFLNIKSAEKKGAPFDLGVREISINSQAGNAVIEFTDKVITEFIESLDGEKLLGHSIRFKRVATEKGFNQCGDLDDVIKESASIAA